MSGVGLFTVYNILERKFCNQIVQTDQIAHSKASQLDLFYLSLNSEERYEKA